MSGSSGGFSACRPEAATVMNVVVSNWSANVVALAAYAVAAVTHLLGVRDAATDAGRQGRSLPPGQVRRAVAFQAGLLLAVLALVSPLAFWSYPCLLGPKFP